MSWIQRHLGIDGIDLTIHAALTMIGVAIAYQVFPGSVGPVLGLKVQGASLLIFAWRRHRGLARLAAAGELGLTSGQMAAIRFEEMEQRLTELDAVQQRVAELEERLEFAERMLAQAEEPIRLPGEAAS